VTIIVTFVETVDNLVLTNAGPRFALLLSPYIALLVLYIFISNIFGLFAIEPPTANFSVTFSLGLITFVLVQATIFKFNGFVGYFKGFLDPFPIFLPLNILGKFAPLVSMPLRLFGNILSGGIIMTLIYTFTAWVSSLIPFIGEVNFLGPIIAPIFHAYFDLFAGAIQMFIFITLTMVFIGNEIPSE